LIWATSGCPADARASVTAFVRDTVEALLDRCEALVDERFEVSIGENVGPVVFDGLANQFAYIERINAVVDR
jgi:class 3 adenylate cyclase